MKPAIDGRMVRHSVRQVLVTVLLMSVTLLIIIPFLWMLAMSFRTTGEILTDPYGLRHG